MNLDGIEKGSKKMCSVRSRNRKGGVNAQEILNVKSILRALAPSTALFYVNFNQISERSLKS
jgi:hypothetical protein